LGVDPGGEVELVVVSAVATVENHRGRGDSSREQNEGESAAELVAVGKPTQVDQEAINGNPLLQCRLTQVIPLLICITQQTILEATHFNNLYVNIDAIKSGK
jgi:hypothetical protein